MKIRILSAVLAVSMIFAMLIPVAVGAETIEETDKFFMSTAFEDKEDKLSTMTYIMTSDDESKDGEGDGILELYADKRSGEFAIRNKVTGDITLSNPYNASIYSTDVDRGRLLSQVYINYFKLTAGKDSMKSFYSYNDCFKFGQGSVNKTADGLRVDYSLGEEFKEYAVPKKIKLEDFFEAMKAGGKTDEEIIRMINSNFTVYDPDQKYIDNPILSNPSLTLRDEMIKKYPDSVENPFIILMYDRYTSSTVMKQLEKDLQAINSNYFKISKVDPYTGERVKTQFELDVESILGKEEEKELFPAKEYPNFKFTVDYKLTNDGIIAVLDTDSIVYDKDLYCLANLTILPYFDAASFNRELDENGNTQYDNGYLFIPDGSGALFRFEDLVAKNQSGTLVSSLYGSDYAYYQISSKNVEPYTMPVFGLVNTSGANNTGYFAIIEDGDALASITANAGDNYHISVFASFKYAEYDTYDLADAFSGGASSSTKITVVSDNYYDGEYKLYYKLLTDERLAEAYDIENTYDASYVGMAKLYRDYLIANGSIKKMTSVKEDTKLFLEVFGSLEVKEQVLTFPVTVSKELTTFKDVIEMQKDLSNVGINNNSFILKGFYNGGLNSTYPTEIKWQKVLGGKNGLSELLTDAENNGYDVAVDVDFSYSYATKWFSAYSNDKHAVRTLDDRYTTKREYYAPTQMFERTSGVAVSSASFITLFQSFVKSVEDTKIKTLATRALGSDLNSDFDDENYYSREDAKDKTVEFMKLATKLNSRRFGLIVDAGNSYAIPYASSVLCAPLDSSKFIKASESVPFYGMVYHGSLEFAGNALNMEGDVDYMFLKGLENGASLYYTLAKNEKNISKLKFDSTYNKYYSVNYDSLKGQIIDRYNAYNAVMKDKQNMFIADHRFLNDENFDCAVTYRDGTAVNNSLVVLVVYENGEGFILNYNSQDVLVEFEGKTYTVPALDFETYSVKEVGVK